MTNFKVGDLVVFSDRYKADGERYSFINPVFKITRILTDRGLISVKLVDADRIHDIASRAWSQWLSTEYGMNVGPHNYKFFRKKCKLHRKIGVR